MECPHGYEEPRLCPMCRRRAALEPATEARTLYRAQDPATSRDAALGIDVTGLELMVLEAVEEAGEAGITQDELLLRYPDYSYSSVTARPKALKVKGLIFDSGQRRVGRSGRAQAVLKHIKYREDH